MSIVVDNLSFSYGSHAVLSDVSFTLESGELMAVLGPNGVGKTTLLRCIMRLLNGFSGRVTVDGKDVSTLNNRRLAQLVAYIPQQHEPAFSYSVSQMVLMGSSHMVSMFSAPGRKERELAEAAMDRVGISRLADRSYSKLSGGEQQLVLIARALAQQSKTLLMDEPTANLDYGNQAKILELVRSLVSEGYAVLLNTHNPQHALWYANKALALHCGKAAACGKPADILNTELIGRLYGIKADLISTDLGDVIVPAGLGKNQNEKRKNHENS